MIEIIEKVWSQDSPKVVDCEGHVFWRETQTHEACFVCCKVIVYRCGINPEIPKVIFGIFFRIDFRRFS
jgi:hypothetical protein